MFTNFSGKVLLLPGSVEGEIQKRLEADLALPDPQQLFSKLIG